MQKLKIKSFLYILLSLMPALLTVVFFISSKFILLDDHEIYRLSFHEINFFTAVVDDWISLFRFRPFYWLTRQLESIFFGVNPFLWYGFSWCLFSIALFSLYSFFRTMGFKWYASVVFAWISVLGYQSMGTWMALGVQEGLALTLISLSFLYVAKYQVHSTYKPLLISFIFFVLAFLTKETFAFLFPFFIAILFIKHRALNKLFYRDSLVYLFGFCLFIPIVLIQGWRSYSFRSLTYGFKEATFFQADNLSNFSTYVLDNKQIVSALVLFVILFLINILNKKKKITTILLIGFLSLLGIFSQVIIYSFTEYIARHYIQPFSLAVVLSLAFMFSFSSFKQQILVMLIILLTLPMAFLRTLEYANGHNYHSRLIYELEQQINTNKVKSIVLIGDRSNDHEKIFSLNKRIHFLYPDKRVYFYQYNETHDLGMLDVSTEVEEIDYQFINNSDLLVSFGGNFNIPSKFKSYDFKFDPIITAIDHSNTWYVDAPTVYYK